MKEPIGIRMKFEDGVLAIVSLGSPVDAQSTDAHQRHNIMDAVRVSDGRAVMMKLIEDDDPSEQHMRFFCDEARKTDDRNHCLPLLDVLRPPSLPRSTILVSPRLVPWNVWPFTQVCEVVALITQLLEVGPLHREVYDLMLFAAGSRFHARSRLRTSVSRLVPSPCNTSFSQ